MSCAIASIRMHLQCKYIEIYGERGGRFLLDFLLVNGFIVVKDAPFIKKLISTQNTLFVAHYQAAIATDSWAISLWCLMFLGQSLYNSLLQSALYRKLAERAINRNLMNIIVCFDPQLRHNNIWIKWIWPSIDKMSEFLSVSCSLLSRLILTKMSNFNSCYRASSKSDKRKKCQAYFCLFNTVAVKLK